MTAFPAPDGASSFVCCARLGISGTSFEETRMIRKTRSASQLQDEVSRRIQRLPDVLDEGVKIRVPRPRLQEPDATGCNWDISHFGNMAGHERDIAAIVAAMRKEFNLATGEKDLDSLFGNPSSE
jgi:hypothetical protein